MTENDQVQEWAWLARILATGFYLPGADRDDAMQEALVGLLGAVRGWDPSRGPFRPFAELCITRQLVTALKTAQRGKHEPLTGSVRQVRVEGDLVDALDAFADPHADPADVLERRDQLRRLVLAARMLTPTEREAFRVVVLEGGGYMRDGRKDKRIDNALCRARRKLREAA